jgi:hypothetical protein
MRHTQPGTMRMRNIINVFLIRKTKLYIFVYNVLELYEGEEKWIFYYFSFFFIFAKICGIFYTNMNICTYFILFICMNKHSNIADHSKNYKGFVKTK